MIVQADIAEAVRAFLAASLHLATVDSGRGGLQFPHTVATAVTANVMAANIAASAFSMLSTGNARVLTNLGTPAQIEAFAVPSVCRRGLKRHVFLEPEPVLRSATLRRGPTQKGKTGVRHG